MPLLLDRSGSRIIRRHVGSSRSVASDAPAAGKMFRSVRGLSGSGAQPDPECSGCPGVAVTQSGAFWTQGVLHRGVLGDKFHKFVSSEGRIGMYPPSIGQSMPLGFSVFCFGLS